MPYTLPPCSGSGTPEGCCVMAIPNTSEVGIICASPSGQAPPPPLPVLGAPALVALTLLIAAAGVWVSRGTR